MNIVSLFSGCGGLDLGFEEAGFNVIWANEYDKSIWDTYEFNHPNTQLDKRDIRKIVPDDIPDCIGIIGGPPCQSWSEAGAQRGIDDSRGRLFFDYIRILKEKKPLFFLAENVGGILAKKHDRAFTNILSHFKDAGYEVTYQLLNAADFLVPQDRKRVIIIGYREDMGGTFEFPRAINNQLTLQNAIYDIKDIEAIAIDSKMNQSNIVIPNHEYKQGSFSSIYMSRNRVRSWNQPSFTIQAGARHAPIHPQANKMIWVEKDKWKFDEKSPKPYRRLSVRECARIQTFPDNFIFKYKYIGDGYKMIGNAVPVMLAKILSEKVFLDIKQYLESGFYKAVIKQEVPRQLTLF
ncbi:DNA-methyltransferase Dcm [Rivularia sp. PCC 7116]|uniref:DNA cytosine methyltransferase n=1 Tax=Rivularia sp. PCC 7116 TaxID=373994 RepID=UPI00029ECFAC|nr:DNA cytosine methyltransferase [Rivularia sp. PCC 7116]AFY58197.1 DNA-methyltransferase Dcm [Rivularia sp. PCC 7116]